MKKIIGMFVITVLMSSCTVTPIIGSTNPFVVNEIRRVGDGMSRYTSDGPLKIFESDPAIILPTGMFNVGDTIRIERKEVIR